MPDHIERWSGWRAVRQVRVSFLRDEDAPDAARRAIEWWTARNAGEANLAALAPVVVSRAELIATMDLVKAPDDQANRKERVAWNARIDRRLITFLARMDDLVEQPRLKAEETGQAGVYLIAEQSSDLCSGYEGLKRALVDLRSVKTTQRLHVPVYLNAAKLAAAAIERTVGRGAQGSKWKAFEDLEHVLEVSARRLACTRTLQSSTMSQPVPRADGGVDELYALREEVSNARVGATTGPHKDALACIVLSRANGERRGRVEFQKEFWGDFTEALDRLDAAVKYRFARTRMARGKSRKTSVLQVSMIAAAVEEAGDLEEVRSVLREAQQVHNRIAKAGGRETIVGVAHFDRSGQDDWRPRAELEAILDFWQQPRSERKTVREFVQPNGFKLPVAPHEKGCWRLRRQERVRSVNGHLSAWGRDPIKVS